MASYSTPTYGSPRMPQSNLGAFWMAATVLLGLMVAVVGFFSVTRRDLDGLVLERHGLYPFVSHAFAHVDLGQVGLLKVGNPMGTMSH